MKAESTIILKFLNPKIGPISYETPQNKYISKGYIKIQLR